MPQKYLPFTKEKDDGRIKIPKNKHPEIIKFYKECKSQRKTAKYYKVSRRLIQFIINPKMYEETKNKRKKEKVHLKYYDKDKRRNYTRKYRLKKRQLNLLINKTGKVKFDNLDDYSQPEPEFLLTQLTH